MNSKEKDTQDFTHRPRIIVLDESDFDGSWAESEEGKRKLAELKEWLKDKELGDYSNPCPIINKIYLPKRYLKWEDLEFSYGVSKIVEVFLNGTKYTLQCYKNCIDYTYVKICLKSIIVADLCSVYEADKQFFNDLHLERAE